MQRLLVFPIVPAVALALCACDTMTQPISSTDFNPLNPIGSQSSSTGQPSPESSFSAGQFVKAMMNNTAFYLKKPRGEGNADKLLAKGTSMKVLSSSSNYTKVELDSGEVGFIPTVMLEDASSSSTTTQPGEYQVYPPTDNTPVEPLPTFSDSIPPPDGAIPVIIDPEAPPVTTPPVTTPPSSLPPVTTPPVIDATPEPPVQPNTTVVPLPPNGRDE